MLERYVWAIFASLAILSIWAVRFIRFRLIRRTFQHGIVWQVYGDSDTCRCKLSDISKPDWPPQQFRVTNGYFDGKYGEVQYKLMRSRGLFFMSHFLEVLQDTHLRRQERKGLYFRIHFICMAALVSLLSLKAFIRPSGDDIRMLIGLESFGAARLCRLREKERLLAERSGKKSAIS